MFLAKNNRKGRIYLSIIHGYRDKNGKNHNRTIKTIGYADQYKDQYKDPIAHFEQVVKEMNEQARQENAPITIKFHPKKKIDMRITHELELGSAVPSKYFHHDLDIWRFFDKKRTARNFKYDPCRILELLTWNRLTNPSSKKRCFENKDAFPRKCNFSLNDVYRSLTYLNKNADKLIDHMNQSYIKTRGKRKTTHLYYDVTNYYFEIEDEDDFRMRGVSKEHRPNPIVQMGLLLDSEGIPINYELFAGNTNDNQTMLPIMKKAGLRAGKDKVIMIADKGLNTSTNIAACILDRNGYIFSQSVRKAKRELKEWVLAEDSYSVNSTGTFRLKSRQSYKIVYVESEDGKKRQVKVPVKEVAFWSKDFADRSKYEREKVIQKSVNAIANKQLSSAHSHTSIKYAKDVPVNKKTGEMASHNWIIDDKKIEEDARYDGYYCIITSETDMKDRDIIDAYRGLWKIEESFKVTKSDLSARPVFVSTEDHIKAHFLVCYIALLIMRLIQKDTKNKYSTSLISDALRKIVGHRLDTNLYYFDYRTSLTDELGKIACVDLSNQVLTKGEIDKIMSKVKNM